MPDSASNPSMAFRRVELLLAGLAALALWTSAVVALESVPESELEIELLEEQRQRELIRDLLGSDRCRRLEKARFELALHEFGFSPRLSEDPYKQELVEEILMSTLVRVSKKSVERRLRLMERRDAVRARLHGRDPGDLGRERDRPGLDISPAVRLSDRPSFGARVRLEGLDSWFWSGLSFRVRHEVSGGDLSLKLGYDSRGRSSFLIFHTEHRSLGEAIEWGVRFSF